MRNRPIAVFVGQSYLNYIPNMDYNAVLLTSGYEKHFIRKSVQLARKLIKRQYHGENE